MKPNEKKVFSAGALFGAILIGAGVGYMIYRQSGDAVKAVAIGAAVGIADYVLLGFIHSLKK